MIDTTGTPTSAPIATEPGTPVVVSILVEVGDDWAKTFSVDAMAGAGVDPYRVADSLAGALRGQVRDYTDDLTPGVVDLFDLLEVDDPDDPS